ncbi:hypothetical protein ACFZBU_47175, partial [Embleya sp. NPDC008237]|uniref:hypothetical protein n=1 Tax=Embleya sp. NPDC008237 TaxID=3363978 RepID=UPI0036E502FE
VRAKGPGGLASGHYLPPARPLGFAIRALDPQVDVRIQRTNRETSTSRISQVTHPPDRAVPRTEARVRHADGSESSIANDMVAHRRVCT